MEQDVCEICRFYPAVERIRVSQDGSMTEVSVCEVHRHLVGRSANPRSRMRSLPARNAYEPLPS
jgi:hypothetical protein